MYAYRVYMYTCGEHYERAPSPLLISVFPMKNHENGAAMNIILIGMPGVGKSTLGVLLAEAMKMSFIDTDTIIQERAERSLQDILDSDGVDRFLIVEEQALLSLQTDNTVISTGGSVIYSQRGMTHLKDNGLTVYLWAPYLEIENRLDNLSTRGVVIKPGRSLKDTYDERVPLYEDFADLTVTCSEKNVEVCVKEITEALRNITRYL